MAGDVAAFLGPNPFGENTVLTIVGDNQANQIRVIEDGPNHAIIEGLNGTTVNGKAVDEVFSTYPVFQAAEVRLGNGDDTLIYEFTGQQFRHFNRIETGNGDDTVTILAKGVVGVLNVDTGQGADRLTLEMATDTFFIDGFTLLTGGGDDWIAIRGVDEGPLPTIFRFSLIDTAQGNDTVQFEGLFGAPFGRIAVTLEEGNDTLIGDPEHTLPGFGVQVVGGTGVDTALNASYFGPFALQLFETIEE